MLFWLLEVIDPKLGWETKGDECMLDCKTLVVNLSRGVTCMIPMQANVSYM